MTPYGIVYKDTVASLNEGADIWQKKSGIINKKYVVISLILISIIIIGVNRIILSFYENENYYIYSNLFYTFIEIVSVCVLMIMTLKKRAKNIFLSANSSKTDKQAVLREEDIEFSTPMSKTNYYYDEIDSVIEGVYSLNIIIEKGNLPVCISKTGTSKGDIEKFLFVLKEKMKDRYFYENRIRGNGK